MHLALDQDRPAADPVTATEGTRAWTSPELSVVVATLNERDNVAALAGALERALTGTHWEVIFVDDDSPDGTAEVVARHRAGATRACAVCDASAARGLAGACIEGMLASSARAVAVMDADLQHDETLLPRMLDAVRWAPISSSPRALARADRRGRASHRCERGAAGSPIAWRRPDPRAAQRSHERLLHDPA